MKCIHKNTPKTLLAMLAGAMLLVSCASPSQTSKTTASNTGAVTGAQTGETADTAAGKSLLAEVPGGPSDLSKYRLGAGDELDVFVWKEEDLSRSIVVSPDGSIAYPLAGEINASGMTIGELKDELSNRIREYIPKALVTVSLVKVTGYKIYVLGEVNDPGEFTPGTYVTVAQALTLADGLTGYANTSKIRVVRQQDGTETSMSFNYDRFKRGKELSKNIVLQTGDVVMVP